MHHPTSVRRYRFVLFLICTAWLSFAAASHATAEPPPSWADLLTLTSVEHPSQFLASPGSTEGIQVEVHSKALTRGTPQLHIQTQDGTTYHARLEHLSWSDHGVINWVGRIVDLGMSCPVLLSARAGRVVGVIETPEGRYEIVPTPQGHILSKDTSQGARCNLADRHIAALSQR